MEKGLTQDEIDLINEILLPEDILLRKADAALVLGYGPLSGYLADVASTLHLNGQIDRIVVSGGIPLVKTDFADALMPYAVKAGHPTPLDEKETEADYMKRILRSKGIPQEVIATERASENLSQNMMFSKPMLKNAKSIILVVGAGCTRRALDTARTQKIWPWPESDVILGTATVYPLGLNQENWMNDPFAVGYMRKEYEKLTGPDNYYDKGFCAHADWESERRLASSLTHAPGPVFHGSNHINSL